MARSTRDITGSTTKRRKGPHTTAGEIINEAISDAGLDPRDEKKLREAPLPRHADTASERLSGRR